MINDINDRFELLIFETAEEYIFRTEQEEEARANRIREYEKEIEERGICESCGADDVTLRWVRDREFYSCYQCFIEDLATEGSLMVPVHNVKGMKNYLEEWEWEAEWETEEMERHAKNIKKCG